jgi:hypothetical protein
MRQFFESVLAFQTLTSRFNPMHRYVPVYMESKSENRMKRFALYCLIFAAIYAA